VRFQVLTAASMKMAVFWVVVPCSLVQVYRVSEVLAASIIRAMSKTRTKKRFEIRETDMGHFLFSLPGICELHLSFSPLLVRLWSALLPLAPLLSPDPHPLPHWSGQGSTLSDWLPHLKPIPRARLTHRPDDGGNKHL
jgi:hypothetical protein